MQRSTLVTLVVVGVLVLGVGGAVAVTALSREDAPATAVSPSTGISDSAQPRPADSSTAVPGSPSAEAEPGATPGAYVDYSAEALAAADGDRVLFFHAPWCPQCRALESDIAAVGVPDGVTILKVDYDTGQALRQQYGVRQQTTVVLLDDQGSGVASFVAYDDPTLDAALAGLGLTG